MSQLECASYTTTSCFANSGVAGGLCDDDYSSSNNNNDNKTITTKSTTKVNNRSKKNNNKNRKYTTKTGPMKGVNRDEDNAVFGYRRDPRYLKAKQQQQQPSSSNLVANAVKRYQKQPRRFFRQRRRQAGKQQAQQKQPPDDKYYEEPSSPPVRIAVDATSPSKSSSIDVANSSLESPTSVIQTTGPRSTRSKVTITKELSDKMKQNHIKGTHRKIHMMQDNTEVYKNHVRRRYSIVNDALFCNSNDDDDDEEEEADDEKKVIAEDTTSFFDQFVCGCSLVDAGLSNDNERKVGDTFDDEDFDELEYGTDTTGDYYYDTDTGTATSTLAEF